MDHHELLEAYVADVALRLPRRQRNDVAFELRALLDEELAAKAADAGRPADAAMAAEFLAGFGHPADVAARYRPALTIIDPADGRAFLRITLIGLAVIWTGGLLDLLLRPAGAGGVLGLIGQWLVGSVVASLWWPGVLVTWFGFAAHDRRRRRQPQTWSPRAADAPGGSRASQALAIVGILCGVFVLAEPRWLLDVFWSGNAAPAAYDALTYTDAFRAWPGPLLFALVLTNVPLMAIALWQGRRSTVLRRVETVLGLATCAVMTWVALAGPVLMTEAADRMMRFLLLVLVVVTLGAYVHRLLRRVRPAPAPAHD